MRFKLIIATATTAAVLVTGGGSAAFAATGTTGATGTTRKAPAAARARGKVRRAIAAEAWGVAAKTIGIERKDLVQAVRGGQTIAAVAQAHGVDPQKVIDALVTGADAKIDKVAQNRNLDATRVTKLKQVAAQRITTLVNDGRPAKGSTTPTS